MAATRAFTPRLPTEVERMIFSCLPNTDLKNVRLSNKQWSASAAMILWKELTIDLIDSNTRNVVTILDSNSNGILDNLKNLSISTCKGFLSQPLQQQVNISLLVLLGTLKRDCLNAFISSEYALSKYELGILLRNQTQIKKLAVSLTTDKGGPPGENYIKGALLVLEELFIKTSGTEHHAYQGYFHWFAHTPNLRKLCIEGKVRSATACFDAWALPDQTPLLKLHTLELSHVQLYDLPRNIVDCLHVPSLQFLEISECENVSSLLGSFTAAFNKTSDIFLEYLSISSSESAEDLSGSLEGFLEAIAGVSTIRLAFTSGNLPGPRSLIRCGPTLKSLRISHRDPECLYTPQELQQLVESCPNLVWIALDLVNLSDTIDAMPPFAHLHVSTSANSGAILHALATSLETLAGLAKLKMLWLTHRPWMGRVSNAAERRWRHTQIANEIMGILADNDSPVHTLCFCPLYRDRGDIFSVTDEDGNMWPYYTYNRGVVSLFEDDSAKARTVAVPSKDHSWD
ncbi:hypothetical protein EKO04_000160 [Ascochyta lentis]|uniref:F-box domain-containing protein n=1 Tax=Ascochyta lentis TaxID=205686 RepID=A0A8H7JB77_9PLEO|nr:hypothetical protein EKO04_000160 [Ascochyta lentis]